MDIVSTQGLNTSQIQCYLFEKILKRNEKLDKGETINILQVQKGVWASFMSLTEQQSSEGKETQLRNCFHKAPL